jgi:hypothetical protein
MVCIFTASFILWFNGDFADAEEHVSVVLNLKQYVSSIDKEAKKA